MTEIVLHHYPLSPYSEKVRAMLGFANLPWSSVVTKEMPPRPMVEALTGGYRRIPVAQSGADIFCDSRVIASEIAALSDKPELSHETMSEAERAWAERTEGEVFFACILTAGSAELRKKTLQTLSWLELLRFFGDRVGMALRAKVPMPSVGRAKALVREQLARIEQTLERDFLFADSPRAVDFATYHGLWFVRDLGEKHVVERYPRASAWMDRIKAFGEGQRRDILAEEALAIARAAQPRPILAEHAQGAAIGTPVRIAPRDYGRIPTSGVLVGESPSRWIVRRDAPLAGTLHVHFPKDGYVLTQGARSR